MINWVDKSDFTEADIQKLLEDRAYELPTLEFKKDLHEKKGGDSAWFKGECKVSDSAKERLLSELIAFANANGGFLVLGIEEDNGKPPRATDYHLLPDIHKLAEQLNGMCRDLIDPQIPNLHICPVEIGGNGRGVIVFKVPRSPIAPHRFQANGQIYIRTNLNCERLKSMREVHDLVVRRYKEKYEAVWSVVYQTIDGNHAGILTMTNGRLFGGDSQFFYSGHYEAIGDFLFVHFTIKHHFGDNTTAWGDRKNVLTMEAAGMLVNKDKIEGRITRHDGNFQPLNFAMNRVAELP
ncbi:MAG: ATP-binding protein [Rhodospirillales bacterium]